MEPTKCQIYCMHSMSNGLASDVHLSFTAHLKILLTRQLGPARKRAIKHYASRILDAVSRLSGRKREFAPLPVEDVLPLRAGDLVRVKSREEIEATLDYFHGLKGLVFMSEMWQYCDTQQRVFKPLVRFVDERELQVRKARGIVLLERLVCTGTGGFGPCDRSCFFFWREEWLEKIG